MPAEQPDYRLIVVSNRLPIVLTKAENGHWRSEPGSGGLITAMAPVLRHRSGMWIGWPGAVAEEAEEAADLEAALAQATDDLGYALVPVTLTRRERDEFYLGF